ncbi:MAG TPA: hypothetical protein VJ499_06740 [Flavisolibacter sp.]|nr:hypothetical protein [Flavisolibacter sp.]
MSEKQSKGSELENGSNRTNDNKNVTLNDPGAPVVDYGRASQGNMESQGERSTSATGSDKNTADNKDVAGTKGNSL